MNVQSGVILKQVIVEPEEETSKTKKALPFSEKRKANEDEDEKTFLTQVKAKPKAEEKTGQKMKFVDSVFKEIVDMQLIWEEEMIHMIYCDHKTIYIYDEEPDESCLLRTMTGANPNDSITKLRYDHHLSLIASGSNKGRVALWDYEIGNLLGFCSGHSSDSEITAIEFCSPRPIMVTCATDGKVMIWTVRPVPFVHLHVCLA